MTGTDLLVGLVIAVGLVGVLVPILPGSSLIGLAVLGWAVAVQSAAGWVVLALVIALLLAGGVVKYVVPGRRLQVAGIPASTQWTGAALGVVGFFVVPVVGLFVGFVLGVYAAERRRLGPRRAGASTAAALRAVGLSIAIELLAATLAVLVWVGGVVIT